MSLAQALQHIPTDKYSVGLHIIFNESNVGVVEYQFTDATISNITNASYWEAIPHTGTANESIVTSDDVFGKTLDLDLTDEDGYVLARFAGGHIKTKYFDSQNVPTISQLMGKQWNGKTWYGFGTSMTNTSNEGKYPTYLAQLSGMTFVNHGHSGGGITTSSDQSVYTDLMGTDLSGADLVTLEVGANDASASLGTINDTTNATFIGALILCIRYVQANSNAQLVVFPSPHGRYQYKHPENVYDGTQTYGADNHTMLDRDEAIRKVCMMYDVPYIAPSSNLGYARMNASNNYNVDQIHYTNLGGYNFALSIWAHLQLIPNFKTTIG